MAFTQAQINKIQCGEGVVVLDLDEDTEKILGPTRGGAEVIITPAIHDIEFDGRKGKTKGLQVKDSEDATLKVKSLSCSQDVLALALNNASVATQGGAISQGGMGLIATTCYHKNIAVISKTLDGTFKIIKLFSPMHEGAFDYKAVSKSENEHNLEFIGHYDPTDDTEKLYEITESATNPLA